MRAAIIAVTTATLLALSGTAANAGEGNPSMRVADKPGAPSVLMQQLAKATGSKQSVLDKVVAVDTGGATLTAKQAEAIAAGSDVDGMKVLGRMPGSKEILGGTMADLSDGSYDGSKPAESYRSVLLFQSYFLPGYEWCLTMCVSAGHSVSECIVLSRGGGTT